ncbi:MAG: AraC family transcriptional regulator [Stackebrandtia sp.]
MSSRTIAMHHVNAALAGARRRGLDVRPLLQGAGISPALRDDPRARVTPEQFTRLIQSLWQVLDDETMGFGLVPSKRGTFAMMGFVAVCSRDLGAALRRARSFYSLFPAAPTFRLERRDGQARVELETGDVDDPDRFLSEGLLVIWHRFSSWLVGRRIPLAEVGLDYPPPPHAAEYDLMFGCPIRFDRETTALTFPERFLDLPVLQDEASLRVFLRDSPADLLSRRDYGSTTNAQVRRILANSLGGGLPDLSAVAARLAVSPQTLRRQLHKEDTSFRTIKEQLCRDVAIESLSRDDESIESLGRRLGFSEASAFHRAFRRWTGATPGSYRGTAPR